MSAIALGAEPRYWWPFVFRYALQLLTPASIIAKMSGRNQIDVQDIGEMNSLFLDAKRSAGVLLEQEGKGAWATYGRR